MRKIADIREVDDLFAEVREKGVPIFAPNYESFTELLAEFTAAQTIADRFGIKRVPLMPSLTLSYPDRGNVAGRGGAFQDFATPLDKRYTQAQLDAFLRFGYHVSNHDMNCFDGTGFFPNVHAIMTFDHGQPVGDRILLETPEVLRNVGVVMYDVTEFLKRRPDLKLDRAKAVRTMAEAAARYREQFGKYVRIESACDILPEAPAEGSLPNVEETLTRSEEMETFLSISGADFFAPSVGTEHRAKNPEGPDKLYREPLVKRLYEQVAKMPQYQAAGGKIFSLHGSSCLDPSSPKNEGLYKRLHGMAIFRYYTGMANKMGVAVKKWVEDGQQRISANPKEGLHVNGSSGRDWFIIQELQPELTQVMVNIGYGHLGK